MSLKNRRSKVHLIGIGGIGVSGIAELLWKLGHSVSGSDLSENDVVQRLKGLGVQIHKGHSREFIESQKPEVVVYSSAIDAQNPEIQYAREKGIPLIQRAEMLAELMRLKRGIAIGGSHGKTTTTGLSALILQSSGMQPTVVIGGRFDAIGSNASWGEGEWLVAEADESDGSFHRLSPEIVVVTNVDEEHLNFYGSFDKVLSAFEAFIDKVPFYGKAILCAECPHLWAMKSKINKPVLWYGFDKTKKPDYWIELLKEAPTPSFQVHKKQESGVYAKWFETSLAVPGLHNVLNATAAAIVAHVLDIPTPSLSKALGDFRGVRKRFEKKGKWHGHPVIEDYAHHPTEISATLSAAQKYFQGQELYVCFQPHRYSRTRELWAQWSDSFAKAKRVWLLPIYAASEPRESWVDGIDKEKFAENLKSTQARAFSDVEALVKDLKQAEREQKIPAGAPLLLLGAGNIAAQIIQELGLEIMPDFEF